MKPACFMTVLFAASLMLPGLTTADDKGQLEQVEILFKLTRMEQKIDESVASIAQLQLRQTPELESKRDRLMAFVEKHFGWTAMKGDITNMYLQTFTEQELKDMNDFYITPTGQKVINTVPQLVQERNQLAMQRLQQNVGELQQIMSAGQGHP